MASRKRIVLCYILLQASFWGMISSICAYQAAIVLDRGFTTGQAGIFCALCYLASLFTQPVIGGWADRHPSVPIKRLLIIMLLPAAALNLVFYFTRPGFLLTALIIFLFGVLETNSYPLIDSMGMQYVNAGVEIPYSFARGMGSLTYAVLCVVTGLLTARFGMQTALLAHCAEQLLLLVCLLAGCGSKEQTATPDFVLTYADNQPADYPTTQGAERFAALVKERTGGKVVIQVKSGGEYGTEQEVWQQLSIGGIDFARLSLSVLAADLPKLNVLQLPCLYEDAAHMWRVLDGPIGEEFLRVFAERDMVGLSWYDAGARSFYSDKSLRSLEDLQGMTIRVQDANVVIDMVKLLGGDPVTLAYSDVYAAFETDKIDAAENNWPAYLAMEHYKVARYYLVDEHSRVPEIQLASGKTWAKLPDEYRSVLRECARESARYERELWTQQEAAARKTVLAAGCREIQLSDEEKERFRELVQPLYEKYAGPYLELVKKIQQG